MRRTVTHSLVQALRVVPAFSTLDDAALLTVVGASANLAWRAGRTVFEKGTPGDALYVVLSGRVAIVDVVDGADVEVTVVEAGDFFGEFSLLLDTSHSLRARALDDCELMVLPKDSLAELCEDNPELAARLRRKLEERAPAPLPDPA